MPTGGASGGSSRARLVLELAKMVLNLPAVLRRKILGLAQILAELRDRLAVEAVLLVAAPHVVDGGGIFGGGQVVREQLDAAVHFARGTGAAGFDRARILSVLSQRRTGRP